MGQDQVWSTIRPQCIRFRHITQMLWVGSGEFGGQGDILSSLLRSLGHSCVKICHKGPKCKSCRQAGWKSKSKLYWNKAEIWSPTFEIQSPCWEQTQAANAGKTQQKDRTKEHRRTNEEWGDNTGLNTQEWLSNGTQVSRINGEKAHKDRKGEIMIHEDVIYKIKM